MVTDKSPYVRRVACENCVRLGVHPTFETLVPMLASSDRVESLAARRVLERIPVDQWQQKVLATDNKSVLFNGAVAMLTAAPTLERSYEVLAACSHLMDGFLDDREFVALLRTVQVALVQGEVDPERVPGLTGRIVNEFPSASPTINRELARILGYLKAGDFSGRLSDYLNDKNVSDADKLHVAMYMTDCQENLTSEERLVVLDSLESAEKANVGSVASPFVKKAIANLSETVAGSDIQTVLANGHRWPKTVLSAFYKLPEKLDGKTVDSIVAMDQRMVEHATTVGGFDRTTSQVRLGTVAILARDGSDRGMQYLRRLWQQEPERRSDIVIGLAQVASGENWAYLVGSLPDLDDLTAREVLQRLTKVGQRPREAQYYRQVIELGYRLRGKGALDAAKLLQHWSGSTENQSTASWKSQLKTWSQWYTDRYPESQTIADNRADQMIGKYSVASVVDRLNENGLGDVARGSHVFAKANCATCHRLGNHGRNMGPDLRNLVAKFSLRETVEATIDPDAHVSERYQSKKILTVDGVTHEGMAIAQADGSYVLLNRVGKAISISAAEVQSVANSNRSSMPEGLLDGLSETEVSDLMAFLMKESRAAIAGKNRQPEARIGAMPTVQQVR